MIAFDSIATTDCAYKLDFDMVGIFGGMADYIAKDLLHGKCDGAAIGGRIAAGRSRNLDYSGSGGRDGEKKLSSTPTTSLLFSLRTGQYVLCMHWYLVG